MAHPVHPRRHLVVLAAALALAGCALPGQDRGTKVLAQLSGAAVVPPVETDAAGAFDGRYDRGSGTLRYRLRYIGLSGPATGAHIHGPAIAGQNAGVLIPFQDSRSPIEGTLTLSEAQAAELLAGRWYVAVHTAAHPGGELRGQLQASGQTAPEPPAPPPSR